MNRHRHSEAPAVWASYEYLIKERLESIDRLASLMYSDLINTGMRTTEVRKFMAERFAELWERVASEQEEQANGRKAR